MRARLERLGVTGVRASTFHSAALVAAPLLPARRGRKDPGLEGAASSTTSSSSLPAPFKFRAAGDLATEIEWARNRRIPPARYRDSLDGHAPPIPADLMQRVYERYELRKREQGLMDFEDLLERAIEIFDDEHAVRRVPRALPSRSRSTSTRTSTCSSRRCSTRGSAPRDDLCVVGDDYQSIYGFTGATPEYLLGVAERFPHAEVIRLEENYRSTPQVLELANRLVPKLGGAEKVLRADAARRPGAGGAAVRDAGGRGRVPRRADPRRRVPARGDRAPLPHARAAGRLRGGAARGGDPVPGRGAARARGGAAACCARSTRRRRRRRCAGRSRSSTAGCRSPPDGLGEREQTRQSDLSRLVRLAEEIGGSGADFRAELERRFGDGRRRAPRRAPAHLPRRQGPRVRGRASCRDSRRRSCRRSRPARRRDRRGAAAPLRRHDAREARLAITWVEEAEPLPRRARRGGGGRAEEPPEGFEALKAWRLDRARGGRRARRTSSSTTRR